MIIIAAILIIGCYTSFLNKAGTKKEDAINLFLENRAEFELVGEKGINKGTGMGKLQCSDCNSVKYFSVTHPMVEFIVSQANGISAYTTYKGVYYCPDDAVLGYNGVPYEMEPDGDGWSWKYDGGCSYKYHGYVEKIDDCWYYFEAVYR